MVYALVSDHLPRHLGWSLAGGSTVETKILGGTSTRTH